MLVLHSTADPMGQPWSDYSPAERIVPLMLRTLVYTARTELFLIISLFLLLLSLERRPRGYGYTIMQQAQRLLVPFLFWTFFYSLYNLIKADAFGYLNSAWGDLFEPKNWLSYIALGKIKYHMHFLPTLFALVLFYPLYRMSVRYPWLGIVGIIVGLVVRRELDGFVYATFWGNEILPYLVRMIKVLTYVGYGMVAGAGVGLWRRIAPEDKQFWFPLIMFFGGLLFLIKIIATWKTIETGEWPFTYTPGYWADFLMPVVLFAACLSIGHKEWPTLISRLAPYSFGIYLCHPIFLDLCEIYLRYSHLSPSTQVFIKVACTLTTTTILVTFLSRYRIVAWTVGLGPLPSLRRTLFRKDLNHDD